MKLASIISSLSKNSRLIFFFIFTSACYCEVFSFDKEADPVVRENSYFENVSSLSQKCKDAVNRLLINDTSDFFKMVDSSGHPQGFMGGNLAWLGNYAECNIIPKSRYCLGEIKANLSALASGENNYQKVHNPKALWGVCMPEICLESDFSYFIHYWSNVFKESFDVQSVHCVYDSPALPYSVGFYCTMGLIAFLKLMCMVGWLADKCQNRIKSEYQEKGAAKNVTPGVVRTKNGRKNIFSEENDSEVLNNPNAESYGQTLIPGLVNDDTLINQISPLSRKANACLDFLSCFAINKNLLKLMKTEQSAECIGCLHGIRVISMMWIILSHTFLILFVSGVVENGPEAYSWKNLLGYQVIISSPLAVDTFFLMSGFLVSYLSMKKLRENGGKMPWVKFYTHRYLRLTPVYGFIILLWVYLVPQLGRGPLWYKMVELPEREHCKDYWWTNLLYINNFYPTESFQETCMTWTCYLACDFQFYIVSPIIIAFIYKYPKIGVWFVGLLSAISLFITVGLYHIYPKIPAADDLALIEDYIYGPAKTSYLNIVYTKPYSRVIPYFVGLVMGFYMNKNNQINSTTVLDQTFDAAKENDDGETKKEEKIWLNRFKATVGWVSASVIALVNVYGVYHSESMNNLERIIYGAFHHALWSFPLAWVIYACKYRLAGYIDNLLSLKIWIPLSRLTYLVYLLHPIILYFLSFTFASSFQMTFYLVAYYYVATWVFSHVLAAVISLTVEYPIASVEKFMEKTIVSMISQQKDNER